MLDVSCGKGGDLAHWLDSKLNMVVGDNNQNAKAEYDKFLEKNNVQEGQWFSRSAIISANTDFVNYFKNKG